MRGVRSSNAALLGLVFAAVLNSGATAAAQCVPSPLASFGPLHPVHRNPHYYVDTNDLALELCLDNNGLCLLELPNPAAPVSFPANFAMENFYWAGQAELLGPNGEEFLLSLALVQTYIDGRIFVGEETVSARVHIEGAGLVPGGTYTFTHPYGVDVLRTDGLTDTIDFIEEIGIPIPASQDASGILRFRGPLLSPARVNPFLVWDPSIAPLAPAGYIGDPAVPHQVVGSPCGTNFFRAQGPGLGTGGVVTDLFSVMGKITVDTCGDGIVAGSETCDDGNTVGGDCCAANCNSEPNGRPCSRFSPGVCLVGGTCSAGVCTGGSPPPCPTAQVVADAHVQQSSPNTNAGTATLLSVDNSPVEHAYLRVNVANLAVPVASATLRLRTGTAASAASNSGGRIHVANSCAWAENTLTWNNRPGFNAAVLDTEGAVNSNQIVDFNITDAIAGSGDVCLAIDSTSTNGVDYVSRQGATASRPQVLLNLGCACTVPTTTTLPPATTTTSSTTTTLAPATTTTTLAAPGVVTQVLADTRTEISNPNSNFGISTVLSADADSAKHTFLRVSVSGLTGPPSSAIVRMRVANVTRAESPTGGRIQRITNCTWNETTVTFNNQPARDGTPGPAQGAVVQNQVVDFNVTSLVPGNGTYCFAITSDSDDGVDYNSREFATVGSRPQFIVTQ
jgi:cysteine-rich repeat protein